MLTKGSKQKHNIPYAWLKAIYTMLQIINPPFLLELRDRPLIMSLCRGTFTYDVRWFWVIFDLPTYPNQIIYYISLFTI